MSIHFDTSLTNKLCTALSHYDISHFDTVHYIALQYICQLFLFLPQITPFFDKIRYLCIFAKSPQTLESTGISGIFRSSIHSAKLRHKQCTQKPLHPKKLQRFLYVNILYQVHYFMAKMYLQRNSVAWS